ncbi:hypothetical protein GGU11DRAFT_343544 [Lentinula aff. detonsa]|nr:hypothetical protein GGU11DRAFT_343544 [Lentinula aff. detonsa]
MLFLVTASRLFTVLYLCVSMLTASGSPLPTSGELDIRLGLDILENEVVIHAVLAIGVTRVHASWTDKSHTQLRPKEIQDVIRSYDWTPLGKAKFKSSADHEQALQALLSIELPPYKETGGDCWDYVEAALETLEKRDELLDSASILKGFKDKEKKFRGN